MHSPLARVILAVLSGYALVLLLMTAYDWIKAEFPQPPARVEDSGGIRPAFYHARAEAVVKRYFQLAPSTREAIMEKYDALIVFHS